MKTRFASSIRLPLIAGALALVLAGCGSMQRVDDDSGRSARMNRDGDRSARMNRDRDRSFGSSGYAGQSGTPGIPPSIDAFSSGYVPFPVQANERASVSGRSFYCEQHYNQPGCQSSEYRGNR